MASSDFPLTEAEIVGLFTQALGYGIYFVSFAALLRALVFGGKNRLRVNKGLLIAAIFLFIFGTLSVSFELRHVLDAFIWYHGPGGPIAKLEEISSPVNVMAPVCYGFETWIADLVLIYRLWIVYRKKWIVVVFPIIVWFGTVASGVVTLYYTATLSKRTNINEVHLTPFVITFTVLSVVQSLICTVMISARIWSIDREISKFRKDRRLRRVLRMIIESAALYTLCMLVFLILFLLHNNGEYPASVITGRVVGIVFNVLIIRVHQGRTAETELNTVSHPSTTARDTFLSSQQMSPLGKTQFRSRPGDSYSMNPVQVNVNKQVTRDLDEDSAYGVNTVNDKV